ncbi:MAG: bifunctional folylpolyglutamate synthase/dihydrofolate synthase [Chitinophagaceae bacterium]|nr:bifunctional folylpolyglutamate synthase/dihydrofolate synthase [Chitinophagaceae bacterium]MCW5927441.1 bifunctional folylpolyglutamate synthase/dihydrofolate synthase [Chitinophagaceae bacterium]
MNYQETVAYLYRALPMFSRTGADAIKKDLTNTRALCEKIGNPQHQLKTIHVAGTNGKGSVSHMLAAILRQNGYNTGLYTSPHLYDFRERIKVNGNMITQEFVTRFTEKMRSAIEEIHPSFFEITVAMAFEYFATQKVNVAVIETGLGGRLDSTNIIVPEVAVITNIGMDHMNILGDSIEEIAREKAGIIKKDTPVVIGESDPWTTTIFTETAAGKNAPIVFADREMYNDNFRQGHYLLEADILNNRQEKTIYHLDLPGIYQVKNLITVLATVKELQKAGWKIQENETKTALASVKKLTGLHGRWEVIHEHPMVVLDVGHNKDGIKQVSEQIELTDYHRLHIIIGMVKDKDVSAVIDLLPREASYYFTKAQIPRALPEEALAALAHQKGYSGSAYPDVNSALRAALTRADKKDMILICGSVFIIAEVDKKLLHN